MNLVDIILHLDAHIANWILIFGPWIYVLVFVIVFAETGLVVTPFLPGDSLLFALGAMSAVDGGLDLYVLLITLSCAGILGDTVNYHIGRWIGPKAFQMNSRWLKKDHLEATQKFYDRWGSFTIVAARFAPLVRTFAPFVAGVGQMNYRRFITYNIFGGVLWVLTFVLAGHFFGNLPVVKRNFHIVIFTVIGLSLIPILWPLVKSKLESKKLS